MFLQQSAELGEKIQACDATINIRYFGKIVTWALLLIHNAFFEWEIAELDCLWCGTKYCLKKMTRGTQG